MNTVLLLATVLAVASCKVRKTAEMVLSNNGERVNEKDYPTLVRMFVDGRPACTATVVKKNPGRILTAGHCVPMRSFAAQSGKTTHDFSNVWFQIAGQKIQPIGVKVHLKFAPGPYFEDRGKWFSQSQGDAAYDIAIYSLGSTIVLPEPSVINFQTPSNPNIQVIGFGAFHTGKVKKTVVEGEEQIEFESTSGELRSGANKIVTTDHAFIYIKGPEKKDAPMPASTTSTVSLSGDSGGPLFDGDKRVIGTVNGGYPPNYLDPAKDKYDDQGFHWTRYVKLSAPEIREFVEKALQ